MIGSVVKKGNAIIRFLDARGVGGLGPIEAKLVRSRRNDD
jgi:hypothetical protein